MKRKEKKDESLRLKLYLDLTKTKRTSIKTALQPINVNDKSIYEEVEEAFNYIKNGKIK